MRNRIASRALRPVVRADRAAICVARLAFRGPRRRYRGRCTARTHPPELSLRWTAARRSSFARALAVAHATSDPSARTTACGRRAVRDTPGEVDGARAGSARSRITPAACWLGFWVL